MAPITIVRVALVVSIIGVVTTSTVAAQPHGVRHLSGSRSGFAGAVDGTSEAARFNAPGGVAVTTGGIVLVTDTANHSVRAVARDGTATTIAGRPRYPGSVDGDARTALFHRPRGVAVHESGVIYVADTENHTIRRIDTAGLVTTVAGLAGVSGTTNAVGEAARFNHPHGVAVDRAGIVYVADRDNHAIRQIIAGDVVVTLAGFPGVAGSADGYVTGSRFNCPGGIALAPDGALYVADTCNHAIRRIERSGIVTTVAGLAGSPGASDGFGGAARFRSPLALTVDAVGNVFIADTGNHTIRRMTPDRVVTTIAGAPLQRGHVSGFGPAVRFSSPSGIALWGKDRLTISDMGNNVVRILSRLRGREFDGDGTIDITVYRPSSGEWLTLGSLTRFTSGARVVFGATGDIPVAGDFDGDGLRDAAVFRAVTGTWFWLMSSTGNTKFDHKGWGIASLHDGPAPGDYDGDGKTDPAVFRPAYGTWFILRSGSGYRNSWAIGWGRAGDQPVPADYDGDGRTDIAVYRPSSGLWFVLPSTTNFTAGLAGVRFGAAGDVPVEGDFDGDGRSDLALYRPAFSTFLWLMSSVGNAQVESRAWGLPGDVPVPGDYDGDGRTDVSVFRNSDGRWRILLSSTGNSQDRSVAWGRSGDVPLGGDQ